MQSLSQYYTLLNQGRVDSTFKPKDVFSPVTYDINGDGHQDLLMLGAYYPGGSTQYAPQQGGLYLGDGKGGFTPAQVAGGLWTVHPRKVLFADFNGDGRADIFIADHGWDTDPFPGAQNRLYLSRKDGGWEDATSRLPALSDFTHTAAAGDIDGDGDIDIFAGNGYAGQNQILAYMLMNDGQGNFALTRSNIPAGPRQILDFQSVHHFPGATLTDMNGDGLPELIVTAEANMPVDALRQTTILWNQGGRFIQGAMTALPEPAGLPNHIDLDVRKIDFNGDGRQDLVVIGTNANPFYDGAFLQLLRNDGGNVFTDVTLQAMNAADALTSVPGKSTGQPWPIWIQVLDFNGDGVMDFAVEYVGQLRASTPLVWLNDGAGRFTVLRSSDFVAAGQEWRLGGGHWFETAQGYSLLNAQYDPFNGLTVGGLLSAQAYKAHPAWRLGGSDADDLLPTNAADNTVEAGGGFDTVRAMGARGNYTLSKTAGGWKMVDASGADGTDTLLGVEQVRFTDMSVDLTIGANAATIAPASLKLLQELYVAFFNRVPDASGLSYWITQLREGQSVNRIAESFYGAAVQYSDLTGYSSTMTNADFVRVIYKNVLGRSGDTAPPDNDVQYWAGLLAQGQETKGSLVSTMLGSAHTFKGNATWGWVADLLDNKAAVAHYIAVQQGISYNTPADSIAKGMAIAAAVTSTDTSAAIGLIGIADPGFSTL